MSVHCGYSGGTISYLFHYPNIMARGNRKYKLTVRISDVEMAEATVAAELLDVSVSQVVRLALRELVREARSRGGYYGGRPLKGERVKALWDFLVSERCLDE